MGRRLQLVAVEPERVTIALSMDEPGRVMNAPWQ